MSEEPGTGGIDLSVFATKDRVPSSALIDKMLRSISDEASKILDEHAVADLCTGLQDSARILSELAFTTSPTDRAESFRYLLMMVAYAIDAALLNSDALEPMFSQPYRLYLLDWGAASPDAVYRRAMMREDRSYRVHGRLGNAKYFSLDLRQSASPCTITPNDLNAGEDGDFEIFFGGSPRERSWWPLPTGTTGLVVRELFDDWRNAQRSHLRIECLDGDRAPRPEQSSARVAAEFGAIGAWVREGAVRYWAERSEGLARDARNRFLPDFYRSDTKLPVTSFGWWELAPGEALLVELPDPEAEFWGFHLATSLWHTLDYANRLTTYNCAQAHRDADGTTYFVVSAEDPGIYNWLDTMNLERGVLILRLHHAAKAVPPRTRLVELSEIPDVLPAARLCTADERREQIAERREGVSHMLCD